MKGGEAMKLTITTLWTLLITASYGQEIPPGTFTRQNPAGDYSVTTTIILGPDHKFTYESAGHMVREKAGGTFRVNGSGKLITLEYDTANSHDINYRNTIALAPKKFRYKKDRLYEIGEDGRLIKHGRLLSRHRRFFIFGDFSRRRKVFLERVSVNDQALLFELKDTLPV